MTNFLIIVVIGILVYMLAEHKKEEGVEKKETSYKEILPGFLNKNCEVIVRKPLASIDVMYSMRGILVDLDEEWILLERLEKKKKVVKIVRIELIGGVKEIRE